MLFVVYFVLGIILTAAAWRDFEYDHGWKKAVRVCFYFLLWPIVIFVSFVMLWKEMR